MFMGFSEKSWFGGSDDLETKYHPETNHICSLSGLAKAILSSLCMLEYRMDY